MKFMAIIALSAQTLFKKNHKKPDFTCQPIIGYLQLTRVLFALFIVSLVAPSNAAVVEDLYSVEIPVVDQNLSVRQKAFSAGLKEVLIRVTGDSRIFTLIKLPYAFSYVKQFQYRELEIEKKPVDGVRADESVNEKLSIPTQKLWVQYNETKVNEYIRNNAVPLWGKHRSESVIWIAVNDGLNRYVLKALDHSLLKTASNESAKRRAIPIIWPEVRAEEQAIRFADVWAGFQRPLRKLSGEYSSGPIIIGRLLWKNERWSSDWSLLFEDSEVNWNIENADYKKLLTRAIDIAADTMGQKFALFDTANLSSLHSLGIEVQNVNSIAALNQVRKYLSSVPLVQRLRLDRIENQHVFFEVSLRSNTDDFLVFLESDSTLLLIQDENLQHDNLRLHVQNRSVNAQRESGDTQSDSAAYRFQLQP